MNRGACALALALGAVACGGGDLGPAESYVLLAPVAGGAGGALRVARMEIDQEPALTLGRLLNDGFTGEMVRTVHLAKQLVRHPGRGKYADAARAAAGQPLCLVVGQDAVPGAHGLVLAGRLRDDARPALPWLGLSANVEGDKALAQSLTGRLAAHAASWIAQGAPPNPGALPPLVNAYRMAMEVIAREWRLGKGVAGTMSPVAGTLEQRALFASVRENQAVLRDGQLVAPALMLADVRVAATVLYRLAQTRAVAHTAGPDEIYTPFVPAGLPAGVSPAAVLGPVRNFQAKLFTAWAAAIAAGQPPGDLVDLLLAYAAQFPGERREVLRIFLVTTFAGTVLPGGVSRAPADATRAVETISALVEDVIAGRRGLRDAIGAAATAGPAGAAAGGGAESATKVPGAAGRTKRR